jgi:hypothetical protein
MLLNRGELGGARILSPGAVALMTANHLSDALMAGGFGIGHQRRLEESQPPGDTIGRVEERSFHRQNHDLLSRVRAP